jgi:predicted small secreted protein
VKASVDVARQTLLNADGACIIRRLWLCTDKWIFTMETTRKYALVLLVILGVAPLLAACHTTAGVGEDLSAGGRAISNEAKKLTP